MEHNRNLQRWDNMQKIFVSYSRKDIDFARKLAGDLEKAGYDVWWDISDLRGGDDWVRTIPTAIETSQFVLVVLSPNSVASEWVEKEYTQALGLRKKIIPVMFESCNVPFALNTINYANFSLGEYEENFKNLLGALGYKGEPPEVAPFRKSTLFIPQGILKFVIPVILGIILLFAVVFTIQPKPVVTPTITPSIPPSVTTTSTPEPATLTVTVTASPTPTKTESPTPTKPTLTAAPTKRPFETLGFCVLTLPDVHAINVRSGPGTYYIPIGDPLRVGRCLTFWAINEDGTWFLVANDQTDPAMQQYEGGWIRRDLLIPVDLTGPINLPVVTLTPTPTSTLTPTITPTSTSSSTPTITPSPTATDTPTPTSTDTSTPTLTPSPEPTETDTPTP